MITGCNKRYLEDEESKAGEVCGNGYVRGGHEAELWIKMKEGCFGGWIE